MSLRPRTRMGNHSDQAAMKLDPRIAWKGQRSNGILSGLASALFLGLSPVFGKQAILLGLPPTAVVAIRTALAAGLLLVVVLAFHRRFLYIYPVGLLGCLLAGGINGFGSLLYYNALGRLDASLGQLLYALYPFFVALWLLLDRQPLDRLTLFRLSLTIPALFLLVRAGNQQIDFVGVVMMLAASALYALHLPINQRVLYDMPAPTVTLYTLIAMSAVVVPAFLLSDLPFLQKSSLAWVPTQAWWSLLALTLVTFFSRLALFMGVKHLGGMQTALLGLGELVVTVALAQIFLGERFSLLQWGGVTLLVITLALVGLEKPPPDKHERGGWLHWLRPPGLPVDLS